MNYLTVEDIKHQLIIEQDFTEDDTYLEALGDAAEDFVQAHLNSELDDITAENSGELPNAIHQALLIMVDYLYDNRGSGTNNEIPNAFYVLCAPWKKYTIA